MFSCTNIDRIEKLGSVSLLNQIENLNHAKDLIGKLGELLKDKEV
jgi:hypothetical protein